MPPRTNEFQELVALIQRAPAPEGAVVTESALIDSSDGGAGPSDPPVVTAPFASGCGLMAALFGDLDRPRAIIGATDIAMRKWLPPDILAFSVTKPMYEQLSALDEHSFLGKPFWQGVKKARGLSEKS